MTTTTMVMMMKKHGNALEEAEDEESTTTTTAAGASGRRNYLANDMDKSKLKPNYFPSIAFVTLTILTLNDFYHQLSSQALAEAKTTTRTAPEGAVPWRTINDHQIYTDSNKNLTHRTRSSSSSSANNPIIEHSSKSSNNELEESQARTGYWSLPNRPSLFSIIRFPNEECFDSSNQSGTCYTAFECKLLGGQPSSPCAAGFGSCCIVSRTCHVTTREKVVYFKNPSYPSTDSDEKFCDLTVEMNDINVCQLRLDFLDFQLDLPTNGACRDDYMEISASGMPPQTVPRLCGNNRNQHCKYDDNFYLFRL